MTSAIIITLFASLLLATTNHIDKFLLTDIKNSDNIKVLVVFSTLIAGAVFTPIWFILNKFAISISIKSLMCVLLSSISYSLGTYFYFKALNKNDTSIIAVMFHLLPVFSYIFALIFFKEKLGIQKIVGSIIILIASIFISVDPKKKNGKNKFEALFLMILSCALFSMYFILFDIAIRDSSYNACAFCYQAGLLLLGLLLICMKKFRQPFINAIKYNEKKYFLLNVTNESINLTGNLLINFANTTIPIAMANILSSFQSIFVFILGILGFKLLPKYFTDKEQKNTIIKKGGCIIISMIGLVIMFI